MYIALLLPNSEEGRDLTESIETKTVTEIGYGAYLLVLADDVGIPTSLLGRLIAFQFSSNIRENQTNLKLVTASQSHLNLHVHEDLGNLHAENIDLEFKIVPINRVYNYILKYVNAMNNLSLSARAPGMIAGIDQLTLGADVFVLEEDPIYLQFLNILNDAIYTGPIILSSSQFKYLPYPQWFIKETIADNLRLLSEPVKETVTLLQGRYTQDYYLQLDSGYSGLLDGKELNALVYDAYSALIQFNAANYIFPIGTPSEFIASHALEKVTDGQLFKNRPKGARNPVSGMYTIRKGLTVPRNFPIFSDIFESSLRFPNLIELFYFLYLINLTPTRDFIREEFIIKIYENDIHLRHSTIYLPDALRVDSASRVNNPTNVDIGVSYEQRKNSLEIYDEENLVSVWLFPKFFLKINPQIDLYDLSLANRLKVDDQS